MTQLADSVVVLDFETTGLSPNMGDRAIEIGAVRLEQGVVTARFQQLMNPGFRVTSFIQEYTGISNEMLADAPSCEAVMADFADFIAGANLVAHNASFDQRFLQAELARVGVDDHCEFACSMLIARRLYQDAPNHKLGSLVAYKQIANDGVFHRALADTEMTAQLWLCMLDDIHSQFGIEEPSFKLMQQLAKQPKGKVADFLRKQGS